MRILTIETSCDESAISLTESDSSDFDGTQFSKISVLGDTIYSQAALHAEFGGVYPNLAKREHSKNLVPALEFVLSQAQELQRVATPEIEKERLDLIKEILNREQELFARLLMFFAQYSTPQIDAIATVSGPGLAPALWVGVNFARALSVAWDKPVIKINHMEGHIHSSLFPDDLKIEPGADLRLKKIQYPALALLLSGGHTELVEIQEPLRYRKLGQTLDDAVGEAYDKVARLLGLSYPGGPEISRLSDEFEQSGTEKNEKISLPRPKLHDDDLDFSFSGLKTAVLRLVQDLGGAESLSEDIKMQIAYEFEMAVQDVILKKLQRAFEEGNYKTLLFGGGVSANRRLRDELKEFAKQEGTEFLLPPMALTGDNSLMSALVAHNKAQILKEKAFVKQENLQAESSWELD